MDLPDASPPRESHRAVFRIPRLGEVSREDWQQLLRFCVVGTSGVAVNLAVFSVLVKRWDVHHMAAATISFIVAWTTNFWLNKHWTFRKHGLSLVQQGARNLVVSLVALGLNLVLVFGRFGIPAMGSSGSALSSTIGRFAMYGVLLLLAWPRLRPLLVPARRESFAPGPVWRTLQIGLPAGVQSSIEYATFAGISVLAGWFGAEAMGGHQVALNLSSLTFMVPAGVGAAASVLVGHAIGEGDSRHARRVAASAVLVGVGFMAICALVMLLAPSPFAHLYTSVPGVTAVAVVLIPIAGIFQVFDGMQAVCGGILRGAGDTVAAMVANVFGFWLIGTPVSLWLGFGAKLGVVGLWWGFVAGLVAVSTFLLVRVRVRLGGTLERVRIETHAH